MKKLIMLLMLSVFSHIAVFAQGGGGSTSIDFVISIDGDIVKSIYRPKIVVFDSNEEMKSVSVSYHPGDLSLNKGDLNYLLSLGDSFKLFLKFEYYQYTLRGNQKVLNYEIEIGKDWLEQTYMVLYINNLDKKRYKGRIKPTLGRNYTFELDYPGGQMIRLLEK